MNQVIIYLPKNINKMLRYLFIVLLFFITLHGFSQPHHDTVKTSVFKLVSKTDSSKVNVRSFKKSTLDIYRKLPEFKYNDEVETPSWWTRFWRWFWGLFNFSKLKPSAGAFRIFLQCVKYLFIALGLAALVFMILKMAGVDMSYMFRRKSTAAGLAYNELLEDIHGVNFDEEIEKAVSQHNYRLAVRLLYLKSLKQLSDAGLINWQP
ncbi:MAG TPA: hypothetical protein VGC01_07320, partial [Mucilaginibacter sp.]